MRVSGVLRRGFAVAAGVAFFAAAGCGGPTEIAVYPVTGKVLVDGKPAAGVQIAFVSKTPAGEGQANPNGVTGEDGSYTLTTRAKNDGAPAGEYKVVATKLVQQGDSETGKVTNTLPKTYGTADTTPLTAKVEPSPNTIPPFEIKTK